MKFNITRKNRLSAGFSPLSRFIVDVEDVYTSIEFADINEFEFYKFLNAHAEPESIINDDLVYTRDILKEQLESLGAKVFIPETPNFTYEIDGYTFIFSNKTQHVKNIQTFASDLFHMMTLENIKEIGLFEVSTFIRLDSTTERVTKNFKAGYSLISPTHGILDTSNFSLLPWKLDQEN